MSGVALATRGLVKRYGRRNALDGFTVSVPRGVIMGLVGRNGAGKTTWMMSVAGLLRPTAGEIDLLGRGPFDAAVHAGRVAILPQDSELPLEATPAELLYRYGRLQGLSAAAARKSARDMLAAVNLGDRAGSRIRALSHGMRKRVMLAQCFLGEPELVLLDEPLNGLDPAEQDRMRRFLRARRGRQTIVISSHNLNDIELLCTHVTFVEKGRVVRTSPLSSLTQAAGRVEYVLAEQPADWDAFLAALAAALPGADFARAAGTDASMPAGGAVLACSFDASAVGVADVNRKVLPVLLARAALHAVSPGQSLEQAFLDASGRASSTSRGLPDLR